MSSRSLIRPLLYALAWGWVGLCSLTAQSLPEIKGVFASSPERVIPSLSSTDRADLVASYEASLTDSTIRASIKNQLEGTSEILELRHDYLRMSLDSATRMEMRLLPLAGGDYRIALSITSLIPPVQSVLLCYDPQWQLLPMDQNFEAPVLSDFLSSRADRNRHDLLQALVERGSLEYSISLDGRTPQLTLHLTSFDQQPQYTALRELLAPEGVVYDWRPKAKSFVKRR